MMSEQSASSLEDPKTGLVKRLENNIESMNQRNFKGSKPLFQHLQEKHDDTWTPEEIVIALEWLYTLNSKITLAKKDNEIANSISVEFEKPGTEGSASFLKSLSGKAENLLEKIFEVKKNHSNVLAGFVFKPLVVLKNDNIKGYERIGRELSRQAESNLASDPNYPATFREIAKIASDSYVQVKNTETFVPPSIVICASSGTGKTQIPFALKIPLIYCSLRSEIQEIYRNLEPFSRYLKVLLHHDFNLYVDNYLSDYTFKYNIKNFTRSDISTSNIPFRTPGFLLEFIPLLLSKESERQISSWPWLQMTIAKEIVPTPTVPSIAYKEFQKIAAKRCVDFSKHSISASEKPLLPLIFLDEFNFTERTIPSEKCQLAFYRNLIRACGLVPVLMGTNSSITNLITSGSGTGSSLLPWAHVFHKLPPYPETLLQRSLQNLIPETSESEPSFFKLLLNLLANERPLFVQHVLYEISSTDNQLLKEDNWIDLLENIFRRIRREFFTRKESQLDVYPSMQTHFLEFSFSTMRGLKRPQSFKSTIQAHIAHLFPPPMCLNFTTENNKPFAAKDFTFFDIFHAGETPIYKADSLKNPSEKRFEPDCHFDLFYHTPLSSIALLQDETFRTRNSILTVFETILAIKKQEKAASNAKTAGKPLNGRILEEMVNLAFAYASHQGGISGQVFSEWFPHFICQLACARQRHDFSHPRLITNWYEFPFVKNQFPVVAFNSSQWNEELKDYLDSKNIALGIFTGDFHNQADLVASYCSPSSLLKPDSTEGRRIKKLSLPVSGFVDQKHQAEDKTKTYLFIECKFHYSNLAPATTAGFINHMLEKGYSCEINMIVGHKFSFERTKGKNSTEKEEKNSTEKEGKNLAEKEENLPEKPADVTKEIYPELRMKRVLVYHLKHKNTPSKTGLNYIKEEQKAEEECEQEREEKQYKQEDFDEELKEEAAEREREDKERKEREEAEEMLHEGYLVGAAKEESGEKETIEGTEGIRKKNKSEDVPPEDVFFCHLNANCSYLEDGCEFYLDLIHYEKGATKAFILVDLAEIHGSKHLMQELR